MPLETIQVNKNHRNILLVLLSFITIALLSTIVNSFWQYDYKLNYFEDVRISYGFDSFLKLFYLLLAVISFLFVKKYLALEGRYYVKIFLNGGICACIFCWYLFISTFLHYTPVFFNNSAEPAQTFFIPLIGEFYRSGTFKEGNHMGLFLLICVFLSHQRKSKLVFLFAITIITTFSTPAFIGCLAYFIIYYILDFLKQNAYFKLLLLGFFSLLLLAGIFSNEYVRAFTINKLTETEEESDVVSKNDRLELIQTGYEMGWRNPFLGVGLSNYSLHYNKFTHDYEGITNIKRIVNNVYLEVFSEMGFLSLALFAFFLILIFLNTKGLKARIGFIIFLVYLNVYPSFTLFFLWFYFAALLCISPKERLIPSKLNIGSDDDYSKQ
jgi:O-antigen ligase